MSELFEGPLPLCDNCNRGRCGLCPDLYLHATHGLIACGCESREHRVGTR